MKLFFACVQFNKLSVVLILSMQMYSFSNCQNHYQREHEIARSMLAANIDSLDKNCRISSFPISQEFAIDRLKTHTETLKFSVDSKAFVFRYLDNYAYPEIVVKFHIPESPSREFRWRIEDLGVNCKMFDGEISDHNFPWRLSIPLYDISGTHAIVVMDRYEQGGNFDIFKKRHSFWIHILDVNNSWIY